MKVSHSCPEACGAQTGCASRRQGDRAMKMVSILLLALVMAGCASQRADEPERQDRKERSLFLGCTERGCGMR